MPSPTTGLQIIEDALGLTNAVGVDQVLTADETSDCLRKLNDLIENWSTQSLAVYGQATQSFNTVSGQAVYTLGTGGNWNTARPVRLGDAAYATFQGAAMPFTSMTQEEFNAIPVKTQAAEFPARFLYVNDYPLGLVTLWPVPNAITPLTFVMDRVLTQIASAGAALSFPPGYADAFVNNLALRLGPLFGKKMKNYPEVVEAARTTLGDIKRANKRVRLLRCDPAYSTDGAGYSGPWGNG